MPYVGPLSHPELYGPTTTERYREAFNAIREAGPGMVFVSDAARREFVTCFGEQFRFLQVIPLYVRRTLSNTGEVKPPGVSTPFLLTVGALEVRKNYRRIIEAFVMSGLREGGYSYVFCGPPGNCADDIRALAASTPGVEYLKFASDGELRWLYQNASGFVLPSLLEGFGLPVLEAGQHGLVSIISRRSAQSEATGDGAIEVDPLSVDDIAKAMLKLVGMPPDERRHRVSSIVRHAANLSEERFVESWEKLLALGDAAQ